MDLTTINQLITCLKRILESNHYIDLPPQGKQDKLNLKSSGYYFFVDINRKGKNKKKFSLQLREKFHKTSPLLRLDLVGPDHPNPFGDFPHANENIPCPHIHIAYPEYGDSIAYPLNDTYARMFLNDDDLKDAVIVLKKFLERCNVGNVNEYEYHEQQNLF